MIDQLDQFSQLDFVELKKLFMFSLAAVLGMFAAYTIRWTEGPYKVIGYWSYMYNPPVIGRSLVTLFAMCLGAGGMDYLEPLRGIHIFIAGAGIGYLVPQNVDKITK